MSSIKKMFKNASVRSRKEGAGRDGSSDPSFAGSTAVTGMPAGTSVDLGAQPRLTAPQTGPINTPLGSARQRNRGR